MRTNFRHLPADKLGSSGEFEEAEGRDPIVREGIAADFRQADVVSQLSWFCSYGSQRAHCLWFRSISKNLFSSMLEEE